jgi:hypothetical protein
MDPMGSEGARVTKGKTAQKPVPAEFYDEAYFTDGSKSNYTPYGPGTWADWLTEMLVQHLHPTSVLDVGCAYGYVVERLWFWKGIKSRTWQGDAADPKAWERMERGVDLVLSTETPEHLTEEQSEKFLELAFKYSDRALLLIAVDADDSHAMDGDLSHVNVKPMSWWEDLAIDKGWVVSDASPFNTDWRSSQMSWAGRFLYLTKPKEA